LSFLNFWLNLETLLKRQGPVRNHETVSFAYKKLKVNHYAIFGKLLIEEALGHLVRKRLRTDGRIFGE
jgi:hypothetical protein